MTGLVASLPTLPDSSSSIRTSARRLPVLLVLAWGALLLNVLTPSSNPTLVPIPQPINQAVAQGSLLLALVLALLANPRIVIRPSAFLVFLSLMAVMALAVSIHSEFLVGSTYRSMRLIAFVACLWLLTPWWGRRDLVLLRAHRFWLWGALSTVVVGAVVAPGKAFASEGRLAGTVWPMPSPQVAHYAAVLLGTSVILWMCRLIGGSHALLGIVVSVAVLIGTHTRTALLAMVLGFAIASASLFLGHARVRRTSVSGVVFAVVAGTLFAPELLAWAARGQSAQDTAQLTGRTKVWSASLDQARSGWQELFGDGLSNKSFNGLPVDSNWIATYLDLGWFGIVVQVAFFLLLLGMAVTHVRGARRALALFLIVYGIVASVTEVGTADASIYILDLVVAAALLVPEPGRGLRAAARPRAKADGGPPQSPRVGVVLHPASEWTTEMEPSTRWTN